MLWFLLAIFLFTYGAYKSFGASAEDIRMRDLWDSNVEGTVQLKSGQASQVRLDDLKQFIEDNRAQIAVQKIPNMGKRRG